MTETIDAWRARGADRLDPVRFRFLEAMARRAAAHDGETRRMLDERLKHLLAVYDADLAKAAEAKKEKKTPSSALIAGGLTELLAHVAERTGVAAGSATAGASDLKSLRYFRSTWSRLSADRRLNQSQAKMPENAGPLNSQHLVHRAITLMRDASPDYLNRLMAYVDTLSWIEQANLGTPAPATKPEGRKSARSKNA
ncbi:DUF2894 domain-containing protein [Variovorax ginsengisoli]|uniref:DUF2894 domain-containing protein n=1 Tax=Variovorax guangxiensis TaxID=1775474 RepID=A0A502DRB9_9BURK|nr:DUF2894 domain-containing protein [Variovorax ginsengisoli]TPG27975.1 DUF2894 domain-containing protein [Variovorax guangxiensis]